MPVIDNEQAKLDEAPFWKDQNAVGEPVDVLSFVSVFLRRWPLIVGLSLLGAALAYGASYLVKPQFSSKAVFLPPQQGTTSTDSALALLIRPPSSSIYSGMLASASVVDDVIEHTNLKSIYKAPDQETAEAHLRSSTAISSDANGFVTLLVTDPDPALAQSIGRNYLTALSRLNDRLAISEAAQRRALFQAEFERTKNDLTTAEVALKRAQEASGVISPQQQIQSGLASIESANADIRAKRVALSALLQGQTEQAPEVQRLRSEIATEEGQLARLQNSSGASRGAGVSASQAPSVGLQFVQLDRDVKYNQVLFDVMAKQYENAKLQETSAAPSVQIVDYPDLPEHKSKPSRRVFATTGFALSFLFTLLFIFISNRLRVLRQDPERARQLDTLRRSFTSPTLRA